MSDKKTEKPETGAQPPDDPREPYPTGNPPDPQEEYDRAFPERKLERERAEKAEKDAAKDEKKAEKGEAPPEEPEEDNTRKGKR